MIKMDMSATFEVPNRKIAECFSLMNSYDQALFLRDLFKELKKICDTNGAYHLQLSGISRHISRQHFSLLKESIVNMAGDDVASCETEEKLHWSEIQIEQLRQDLINARSTGVRLIRTLHKKYCESLKNSRSLKQEIENLSVQLRAKSYKGCSRCQRFKL